MKKKKEFFNNNSNFGCIFSFIVYLILLLILMGISIIFINRAPEKLVRWSFFLIIAFVIFYSDNSRIRTSIVKRLPRIFPFYKQLKIVRGRSDEISILSLYRYFKYNEKVHFGQPTDNRFSPTSMCLLIPGVLFSLWALENHKYNLPVIIQDKETRSGYRSVYYYVIVSPWDEQTEDIRFDVSPQDYRSTDIGDTVTIYQSDGALGMEWYELHINND